MVKRLVPVVLVAAALTLTACSPGPGGSGPAPGGAPKPVRTEACTLVTAAEVSSISGVTFGKGAQDGPQPVSSKSAPAVTETESCTYKNSDDVYVEYFLNTIDQPAATYESKTWADDKHEEPNSDYVALDGQPAFRMVEAGQAGQNFVEFIFYRGEVVVQINTAGVPNGTAEKVAALVAKRM